jgi:uncharacterized protein (TIGR03000 family)
MKRFLAAAVVACSVALFAWAAPAMAGGHGGGGHGGGGHGGGGFHGGAVRGGSFHGSSFRGSSFRGGEFRGRNFAGRGWGGWGGGYLGYPYYGYSYPYYGDNYGYSYPSVAVSPSYYYGDLTADSNYPPLYSGTSPIPDRQSFYSPSAATADRTTVRVELPDPDAKVLFDDTLTTQTGTDRVFTTPPLDPSKSYTYTVRATWMEDGKEVTKTKDVRIQAGQPTMIDFRTVNP